MTAVTKLKRKIPLILMVIKIVIELKTPNVVKKMNMMIMIGKKVCITERNTGMNVMVVRKMVMEVVVQKMHPPVGGHDKVVHQVLACVRTLVDS